MAAYDDAQNTDNPTTGQPALASWADKIRENQEYMARNFAHVSFFESTTQVINNATETDLASNEENSDIGGMHSTSSNTERATVPAGEGGLYKVSAVVRYAANATGYRVLAFRKNNTTNYDVMTIDPCQGGGVPTTLSGSRSLVLAAGDYVTCRVFQNAGGALGVELLDFSMEWRAVA